MLREEVRVRVVVAVRAAGGAPDEIEGERHERRREREAAEARLPALSVGVVVRGCGVFCGCCFGGVRGVVTVSECSAALIEQRGGRALQPPTLATHVRDE